MAVVDNAICKYDGSPMLMLPIKTKVKLDPIHVCSKCDPNVYAYWVNRSEQIEMDDGS